MAKASITKTTILKKVNRKKNPVMSIAQLAREFGVNTEYYRWSSGSGSVGVSAPKAFREQVKDLVGEDTYNKIRNESSINRAYR